MKNFVADGDSIVATAPYAVTPGLGMLIGSLFCVATKTAAAGASTDAVTEGQFDLAAVSAETATPGAVAYWDDANRRVSVSGYTPIGTLPYGKGASVATARVRLQSVAGAVSGAANLILDGASAGTGSSWARFEPGQRIAYALDSGTTATTASVDFSFDDGATTAGQAFTISYASSTVFEIGTLLVSAYFVALALAAKRAGTFKGYSLKVTVLTGGPLSVYSNV